MSKNKVYISIGRHERYGTDMPIEREGMFRAYLTGLGLHQMLPACETIYHSPLPRAVSTAKFEAIGLGCSHILESEFLEESTPSFHIRRFFNQILAHTTEDVRYYHFVTHLPVIEKLGLPFLATGEVCLLTAENWQEMMAENFTLQVLTSPVVDAQFYQKFDLTAETLLSFSENDIFAILNKCE